MIHTNSTKPYLSLIIILTCFIFMGKCQINYSTKICHLYAMIFQSFCHKVLKTKIKQVRSNIISLSTSQMQRSSCVTSSLQSSLVNVSTQMMSMITNREPIIHCSFPHSRINKRPHFILKVPWRQCWNFKNKIVVKRMVSVTCKAHIIVSI